MLNYFRKLLQQAPQSGRVIGDNGTLQNWGDQMSRSFTSFNDLRTREETPQFVWKSVFDKSTLRDAYVEENGGTVTSTPSEFRLSTTTTGGRANNGLGGVDLPDFPLLDGDTYTYALRKFTGVSGTNDQTLSATARENW